MPHNIAELKTQVEALQQHRARTAHDETSPTDQALRFLVKGFEMSIHNQVLLLEETKRLRMENQRQKRKRDMRRSYIAQGGVLAMEEGLRLAEERAKGGEGSGAGSGETGKTSAQRLCSRCKLPGHNIRTCLEV